MQRWLVIFTLCSTGTAELSEYSEFAKAFLASCQLRSQHLDPAVWEASSVSSPSSPSLLSLCVDDCSAGSEAVILDFLEQFSVTVCTHPGQSPSRARRSVTLLLECLETDPSHSEVWFRSCLHQLRPRQASATKSGLSAKNLRNSLQTNWAWEGQSRRLLSEDPGPMLWLLLLCFAAFGGCLAWYCRKSSSCRGSRVPGKCERERWLRGKDHLQIPTGDVPTGGCGGREPRALLWRSKGFQTRSTVSQAVVQSSCQSSRTLAGPKAGPRQAPDG